jgi:hypothetical protein
MFGNKNKKKKLPDLPPSMRTTPSIRDYKGLDLEPVQMGPPLENEEIHGLPSFPDSPMKKGFSQSAIKEAVKTEDPEKNFPNIPPFHEEDEMPLLPHHNEPRINEMEEWKPQIPQVPEPARMPQRTTSNKPIFVKLEKFREAKESLDDIKLKLNEMDELLKMVKDIKLKEDSEIMNWEKEVEKVKSRISSINSNIFENAY